MASLKTLMLELLILANYHWYLSHSRRVSYTIGALLSSDAITTRFNETVSNISRELEADPTQPNIAFIPKSELMASNALQAAQQVCNLIKITSKRMFALVVSHPPDKPNMPPLSASFTCAFYSLPVVGITARQSAFSDKYSHSSFLRTVPAYSQEASVWADLIKLFGWQQVSLIHSDDQEGKTLLSRLERASDDQKKFKIERIVSFDADEDEDLAYNFTAKLLDIKKDQTRAIVLYARKDFSERIFDTAKALGMLAKDWAWIVTEQALSANNVPQGVIGVRLSQASEAAHVVDAVRVVTQGIIKAYLEDTRTMSRVNSPSSCKNNPTEVKTRSGYFWMDAGANLYKTMTSVVLEDGMTGRVEFDRKGDRVLPVYDIVNVKNNTKLEKVGTYGIKQTKPLDADSDDTFLEMLQLDMARIRWPGDAVVTRTKDYCNKTNARGECQKIIKKVVPSAPKSFQKKTMLKVVTKESIPFVMKRALKPGESCDSSDDVLKHEVKCTHTDKATGVVSTYCCKGYCIDLLRRLANRTGTPTEDNFTPFLYELHLVGDGKVGSEIMVNDTKVWTGIVQELLLGEADLAVAPMTITPERAARIEFTKPFKYLGLTILVRRDKAKSNLASFLQPFESTLWVLVGLSVHVVALVLYLLDRFSPFGRFKLAKSSDTEEDALNLSSAMWFAWGVLLNSGIGEGTPRSFSARVLGMVWAGFAMIIVASYTANLAAFLVLDRPEASISGIDDARLRNPQKDFTFATVKDSPVESYFKRQVEYATMYRTMEAHVTQYYTAEEAINAVRDSSLKAFIWDSARLNYEAAIDCDLVTAGEVFGRTGYGLAMKKDNPWLYEMSQAVLNFHERGFMETLDTRWILVKSSGCEVMESSPATLGLTNMAGVFIMVAAGIVAGVALIFIEIAYKKRRGLKEKELELAKNAADRWRGNIEKRKILRKTLAAEREAGMMERTQADGGPSHDRKRPVVHLTNQNGVYFENEGQV